MRTLVMYYSYTGHTRKIAEELAAEKNAPIVEIRSVKRPGKFKAYTLGCIAALTGSPWQIQPYDSNPAESDFIFLLIPVWAGNPPPFVHSALEKLPSGKVFSVKMVSASGKSGCKDWLEAKIKSRGSVMEDYVDIKV